MIELSRHIEILLLDNDCVVVPDLGGFMAHHVTARYAEGELLFLPPLRTLGFNPQLKMNDSLLAQSYVEAYDISYPEAVNRIAEEVNELRQRLDNEGSYELNDIGTLLLNDEGNIVFSPCESGILTPGLYGLSSFEMPLLSDVATRPSATPVLSNSVNRKKINGEKAKIKNGDFEAQGVTTDLKSSKLNERKEEEKSFNVKLSLVRNLAAAAVAIFAFLLFSQPLANGEQAKLANTNFDSYLLYNVLPKDLTQGKPNHIKPEVVNAGETPVAGETQANLTDVQNKEEGTKAQLASSSIKTPTRPYCIVLASQVAKKNAAIYVEQLHQQGYLEARMIDDSKLARVVYGSYEQEEEAQTQLRELRNKEIQFADAWVMKIR